MKKIRLAAVSAIAALIAGAGLVFPASAQAASTYWTFQNAHWQTCLTAGDSGTAYTTSCVGSTRQQWDWVGSSGNFKQLKNRNTGLCLMTDNKTNTNAVWMSTCNGSAGQWWYYEALTQSLFDDLGGDNDGFLRTSPTVKDAVYATDGGQEDLSYYQWTGTHD
ncbi:RICIN domain-containing protein [Streptomyces sp. NBC_01462]|uniref:RICIN domain-containing protein n=1 Tax=Streptomyces sp. NBC_01462 TaxID=2903876 RepID=UPI002E3443FA|nr:RICIN domain-containing protein [Streptomyces sp. NBC_01462]